MNAKHYQKTAAAIIALTLVCGGLPTSTGGFTFFRPSVTANAEKATATFNVKTGVLTLSGNVIPRDVEKYADNESVMYVVAEEGTVLPEDCSYMFYGFYKTKSIDLSEADTSNVTNMNKMFAECHSLSSLNLTNFNTSKVTDMSGMFENCQSLTAIDL